MTLCELQNALIAGGCNMHEQVIALITACIEGGTDIGSEIVSTVSDLGYSKQYAGLTLSKNAGSSLERHHWSREADGRYRMHS